MRTLIHRAATVAATIALTNATAFAAHRDRGVSTRTKTPSSRCMSTWNRFSSSGTARQLENELDARPVGAGVMFVEMMLAIFALIIAGTYAPDAYKAAIVKGPGVIFAAGVSKFLGVLGMPGMTAYFGMKEIGVPQPGETVVVSAASGAVGSVVGQLAKIAGCRAVGVAGGKQKCDYVVKELGFDACVDHKAGNLYRDLKEACPKGADVYFDNVAGEVLETMLRLVNLRARIVACGRIAEREESYCHKNLSVFIANRVKMQGMIVWDWRDQYPEARKTLAGYIAQGRLKTRESIADGIENAPKAFIGMLKGQNFGKQLVKLA